MRYILIFLFVLLYNSLASAQSATSSPQPSVTSTFTFVTNIIQLISTLLVCAATVTLAFLTRRYVHLTNDMVNETRISRNPNVYVDLEFVSNTQGRLVIGNSGLTPAKNTRFKIEEIIPWGTLKLNELTVIKKGINLLIPERKLVYEIRGLNWDKISSEGGIVKITVSFENEVDKKFINNFNFDLSQYQDVYFESYLDPLKDMAKSLMRMSDRH